VFQGLYCRNVLREARENFILRIDCAQAKYPHESIFRSQDIFVLRKFEKRLATFLRKRRGESTLQEFARKIGVSYSTLQRMENCQQNVTITTLELICERLKCKTSDIFE